MTTDTLKQAAQALRDTKPELAAALEAMAEQKPVAMNYPVRTGHCEGRLAKRPYQAGDDLPAVGSYCLVSCVNCDIESDQHRGYSWRKVIGYADDQQFVCFQTGNGWPTVERTSNCWFAEVPHPLYAAPIATPEHDAKVRDAALGEAAKVCEDGAAEAANHRVEFACDILSDRIRDLKSTGADYE